MDANKQQAAALQQIAETMMATERRNQVLHETQLAAMKSLDALASKGLEIMQKDMEERDRWRKFADEGNVPAPGAGTITGEKGGV